MTAPNRELTTSRATAAADAEAIRYMEQAIASGKNWYVAMLEAMGLWQSAEEDYEGRVFRYLIDGEAFDWLLLAERLCTAVDGLLPTAEKDAFLFSGNPPVSLSAAEVEELIGKSKYHQYLNFFYGVTVEEALLLTVQDEVYKERWLSGERNDEQLTDEAYRRIYGETREILLKDFRKEKGYNNLRSITLSELKEFTYWLFKYRIRCSEKARVASDTRKALKYLSQQPPRGLTSLADKFLSE
ncbi:MAG: hypothetical protein PHR56_01470 [Dehalococcoidales bacterium]|nr:hypothetical protein [Dehalococcoidales bacterium]